MNEILFIQYVGFFSSILSTYFSFKQLNGCGEDTGIRMRWSIIISFCASIFLLIVVCQGKIPDFGLVAMSIAIALRGWSDRRRISNKSSQPHGKILR